MSALKVLESSRDDRAALRESAWLSQKRLGYDQYFGAYILDRPYQDGNIPAGWQSFYERGNIVVPGNGNTGTVLDFTVPDGMECVVLAIALSWSDSSVLDGSGIITFNVTQANKPVRNLTQLTMRIGLANDPQYVSPLVFYGNDRIVVTALQNGSITGRLAAVMQGYYMPSRKA
jgi:hypothetical protein